MFMTKKITLKSWGTAMLLLLFLSCTSQMQTREQKMVQYFQKLGIPQTAFVGLLNPDYCGSCTEYSINQLISNKTSAKKVIVTTGKLLKEHKSKLEKAGYSFLKGDQNIMSRNGITLTVCTVIQLENGEIKSMKTIK